MKSAPADQARQREALISNGRIDMPLRRDFQEIIDARHSSLPRYRRRRLLPQSLMPVPAISTPTF